MRYCLVYCRNRCVAGIVDASAAAFLPSHVAAARRSNVDKDWYHNLTTTVETLLDRYVEYKEHLRPISKAPEWTYWGALFFCGTVYTTVGQYSRDYTRFLQNVNSHVFCILSAHCP